MGENVYSFDYPVRPDEKSIDYSIETLKIISAIDENC